MFNIKNYLRGVAQILYYEGEGEGDGGGDPPVTPPATPPAGDKKTFTQDELNKILADDRKKHQAQNQKVVLELENLKKSKTLTDKQKEELQTRIDEINNAMMTKEQLAAKDKEKLEKTYKEQLNSVTGERDTWKNRFTNSTINNVIIREAAVADAFDPDSLIALLGPNTRLAEDQDGEGAPLGTFTPKVKFNDTDKEGKQVTLDLTIPEAVKRMKDIPKYGYLFKNTAVGGLGGNSGAGGPGKKPNVKDMSVSQYREHRKTLGLGRK